MNIFCWDQQHTVGKPCCRPVKSEKNSLYDKQETINTGINLRVLSNTVTDY